jgi:catecholate siderophore receptor
VSLIRSRKHSIPTSAGVTFSHSLLAIAAITTPLAMAAQVHAQEKPKAKPETVLPEIKVQANSESAYKAESTSLAKQVKPLIDTPQVITVIKKELLQEQGAFNLMEALRNTPGITMQLGENGNTSAGDTFQMRGFSTQSSLFVDGLRDLGAVTRDTFNVEQVEVVKGPAGADVGRGAASGYINLASKLPQLDQFTGANFSLNSAKNKRASIDTNQTLSDTSAVRFNAFKQAGGVAGRDHVENNSYGIAPSIGFGLGEKLRGYFYSQHIRQNNRPDGGIPTVGLPGFYDPLPALQTAAKVRSKNYYGSLSDQEKIDADMVSAKVEYDLNDSTVVRNITRYGTSSMNRILTGIYGLTATGPQNTWTISRLRQGTDQENKILANQTNLSSQFDAAGMKHSVTVGVEFLKEQQITRTLAVPSGSIVPPANLYQPNPNVALPMPIKNGAMSDGSTNTAAIYAFDGIDLNPEWQINAGLRYERYNTETKGISIASATSHPGTPAGSLVPSKVEKTDDLLSWKLASVYKLAHNGRLYAAYATSQTPPGGNNFVLSTSNNSTSGAAAEAQKTSNMELGTKWDLWKKSLSLSAAFYRTENTNELGLVDPVTNTFVQFGKRRVEGVELGAVGQINPDWQITAGLATMKTKVLQGSTGNNSVGAETRWSPDLSATLWTSYKLNNAWSIGGGMNYTSEQKRVVDPKANPALQMMPSIPSFWVANAVLAYRANKNVSVQLNVNNLTDKDYINTLNNAGRRYGIGAPRNVSLSVNLLY